MRRYKCKRCGRRIKFPHWIDNIAYGKTCASRITSKIQEQLNDHEKSIRNLEHSIEKGMWKELPKGHPNVPTSFKSYPNREEIIEELIKVLAERGHIDS